MLHTVVSLGDVFCDGNIPPLNGLYVDNDSEKQMAEQQIMSTNPQDFLNKSKGD